MTKHDLFIVTVYLLITYVWLIHTEIRLIYSNYTILKKQCTFLLFGFHHPQCSDNVQLSGMINHCHLLSWIRTILMLLLWSNLWLYLTSWFHKYKNNMRFILLFFSADLWISWFQCCPLHLHPRLFYFSNTFYFSTHMPDINTLSYLEHRFTHWNWIP